jgi:hypothetical protein
MKNMKDRYRLIQRSIRRGVFYCVDKTTGKRTSPQTTDDGMNATLSTWHRRLTAKN